MKRLLIAALLPAFCLPFAIGAQETTATAEKEDIKFHHPAADAAAIKETAARILSNKEYNLEPVKQQTYDPVVLRKIIQFFDEYFYWLRRIEEDHPYLYYSLISLISLLLMLFIHRTLKKHGFFERRGRGDEEEDGLIEKIGRKELEELAKNEAQRGDFAAAARYLFLAAILTLAASSEEGKAANGLLFLRHLTFREMAATVKAERRRGVREFVPTLESGFYGLTPILREEYERLRGIYNVLLREQTA
jgi:hypothetical protein